MKEGSRGSRTPGNPNQSLFCVSIFLCHFTRFQGSCGSPARDPEGVEGSGQAPGGAWLLATQINHYSVFLSFCVILIDSKGAVDLLQETLKEWKAVARLQGELGSWQYKSLFCVSFCEILIDSKGAVDLLQETRKEWKAVARLEGELGSWHYKSIIILCFFLCHFTRFQGSCGSPAGDPEGVEDSGQAPGGAWLLAEWGWEEGRAKEGTLVDSGREVESTWERQGMMHANPTYYDKLVL